MVESTEEMHWKEETKLNSSIPPQPKVRCSKPQILGTHCSMKQRKQRRYVEVGAIMSS